MAYEIQVEQDTSTLNDEVGLTVRLNVLLADAPGTAPNVGETVLLRRQVLLTDTASLDDEVLGEGRPMALEDGTLGDAVFPRSVVAARVAEVLDASDQLLAQSVTTLLSADGNLSEQTFADSSLTLLREEGTLSSSVTASVGVARVLVETARLGDASWGRHNEVVTDGAWIDDLLFMVQSPTVRVLEEGTLGDEAFFARRMSTLLVEQGELGDALRAASTLSRLLIDEEATLEDAVLGDFAGVAWTGDTDNFAMSRFEPYNFQSITNLNGVLYACGPMGLVRLEGELDATLPINAMLESGLEQMGTDRLKLTRGAYLGYRSSGAMSVKMSVSDGTAERTYAYPLPSRPASTWTPTRVPLGRGLRGRYLRYRIENLGGSSFSIQEFTLDVDVSERRING